MTKTTSDKWFDALIYFVVSCIMLITIYPFWTQLILSMSSGAGAYATGIVLWPKNFSLESYAVSFEYAALWRGYLNTIVRTCIAVSLCVLCTALFSYPLSKPDLPFNKGFTLFILFTMLFSGGLIPIFLLIRNLGLLDTVWALVLPSVVGVFNVLIMRNFFRSLPESLEESAKVDGAGYATIFVKIIAPLSKPVIATVALWVGVGHWNAWFDAMIFISDPHKQVLQMVLRKIIIENNLESFEAMMVKKDSASKFAGRELQATVIMLSILPMLAVYPYVQKFFVKGVMIGAVKG